MTRAVRIAGAALALLGVVSVFGNGVAAALFGHDSSVFAWTNGARGTVVVSAIVIALAFAVGTVVGGCAALGSGFLDSLSGRATEIAGTMPSVVAVVVARAAIPAPKLVSIGVVLAVLRGLATAKVVRAETRQLMGTEFFLAARAIGATRTQIFRKHVFPHIAGSALAGAIFAAAAVVGLDAALSFLGLGTADLSWGTELAGAAPRLALAPTIGVVTIVWSLHVVADSLEATRSVDRRFV